MKRPPGLRSANEVPKLGARCGRIYRRYIFGLVVCEFWDQGVARGMRWPKSDLPILCGAQLREGQATPFSHWRMQSNAVLIIFWSLKYQACEAEIIVLDARCSTTSLTHLDAKEMVLQIASNLYLPWNRTEVDALSPGADEMQPRGSRSTGTCYSAELKLRS